MYGLTIHRTPWPQPQHLSACASPVPACHVCATALGFAENINPSGTHKEAPYDPSVRGWCWLRRLTNVQDAVPRPAPPPALQLLVLCVLQPAVVENHTDDALWKATLATGEYRDCRATGRACIPVSRQENLPPPPAPFLGLPFSRLPRGTQAMNGENSFTYMSDYHAVMCSKKGSIEGKIKPQLLSNPEHPSPV